MQSYCSYARRANNHHTIHHDTEHGFPARDDNDLFRRLMLEIMQAGLSFDTVLKRKEGIYRAFSTIEKVAKFTEKDKQRLLQDSGIIRNRLKIEAAVKNAKKMQQLQQEYGSFVKWLDAQGKLSREDWTKLFKKNFYFTGGEIVNEFLMSTGYLQGAHDSDCPIRKKLNQ